MLGWDLIINFFVCVIILLLLWIKRLRDQQVQDLVRLRRQWKSWSIRATKTQDNPVSIISHVHFIRRNKYIVRRQIRLGKIISWSFFFSIYRTVDEQIVRCRKNTNDHNTSLRNNRIKKKPEVWFGNKIPWTFSLTFRIPVGQMTSCSPRSLTDDWFPPSVS